MKQRRGAQTLTWQDVAALDQVARPLRLIAQKRTLLGDYLSNSTDLESAIALAEQRLEAGVAELVTLTEPYDAFDLLELVRFRNSAADPETFRETEHEGNVTAIELAALVLASRTNRCGSLPDVNGHRADANPVVEQVQGAVAACLDAGSMLTYFRAAALTDPLARISLVSVVREVSLRNLAFPHMLEDTLHALFDDPAIEADCRTAVGATVAEICTVLAAATRMHSAAWSERFRVFREVAERASHQDAGVPLPNAIREQVRDAWTTAWSNAADTSALEPAGLAAEAGVEVDTVETVLDLFTGDVGERTSLKLVEDFLRGNSPLRTRPILRHRSGGRVIVHDGLLLPAIRERIEQELKRANIAARYSKRRGDYLETAALALLTPHLPGSVVHKAFEYFVPDPDALVPQTDPAAFTKLVEADGLVLIDDIAIVIEAKAGALTSPSRSGEVLGLRRDLTKIVTDAARQAERLRLRIAEDHGLRLRDGSWMDLGQIREIHTIAVSLEDLTGVVTVTADLVAAGLLPGAHLPWTISLHDLRVISEVLARPAELLLYLRRRSEPNVTRKFLATDELDLFLHMYATGLYVEPDPDEVARELPHFPQVSVADRRRHARQPTEMLTSRTDVLDAWYSHRLGIRQTPAPRPALNGNAELLQLVDTLTARREPGWLTTATTLLEGSSKMQQQWAVQGPALAKQSIGDGRPHSVTVVGGHRADASFVLVWASLAPGQLVADAERHLSDYLAAKKHQMQVIRGAMLLFDANGQFLRMLFNNSSRLGPDPTLDAEVVRLGLKPVEEMTHRPPPRRKAKPKSRRKR